MTSAELAAASATTGTGAAEMAALSDDLATRAAALRARAAALARARVLGPAELQRLQDAAAKGQP